MAFKVLYYFSLQSDLSLLNLVLSSMKWSLPYSTRPETRLKMKEAPYVRIQTLPSSSIYGQKDCD